MHPSVMYNRLCTIILCNATFTISIPLFDFLGHLAHCIVVWSINTLNVKCAVGCCYF